MTSPRGIQWPFGFCGLSILVHESLATQEQAKPTLQVRSTRYTKFLKALFVQTKVNRKLQHTKQYRNTCNNTPNTVSSLFSAKALMTSKKAGDQNQ